MRLKILYVATALAALLCFGSPAKAQNVELKLNVASLAVSIVNPSLELPVGSRNSLTWDYVGAYAEESFMGTDYPFMFSMNTWGYRRYSDEQGSRMGFFYGAEFTVNQYRMNKNIVPLVANDHATDSYDMGHGIIIGFTAGYKYPLTERLNLEASLAAGWQHSRHEGYNADGVRTFDFNVTAEWLPYRAGLSLCYRL